ncbi:MAG: heme biosynthesis protein HemY [Alphaproteobacteria bacterium]|nr:heme biosynthesis protein HemY [Alphaproteobacteria bacterium]
MIRLILLLVVAALAGLAAVWLAERPGAITIEWQGWRIEAGVGVTVAAGAAATVVLLVLHRFWRSLVEAPDRWRRWRRERRKAKGYRALTAGLVAVAAGDAKEAAKQAGRSGVLLDEPPLTLLLSAQAAQLAGNESEARRHYQAMLARPETRFLGLRGLTAQAMREGDQAAALAHAKEAATLKPKSPWVAETLLELQGGAGQWIGAETTLDRLPKGPTTDRHRAAVLTAQAREARVNGEHVRAASLAREAHRILPDFAPAAAEEIRALAGAGKTRAARKAAESAWRARPHPDVVRAIDELCRADPPAARLAFAKSLAAMAPIAVDSRLLVAEAAIAAREFALARDQLDAALAQEDSRRIREIMAHLDGAELGEAAASDAKTAAQRAPSGPAWTCRACGGRSDRWEPTCPSCGAFDRAEWTEARVHR